MTIWGMRRWVRRAPFVAGLLVAVSVLGNPMSAAAFDITSGGGLRRNSSTPERYEVDPTANFTWTGTHNFTSGVLRVPNSTTLPGTCAVGDVYMDTDATSGQRIYACESTNTWVLQGDGTSAGLTSVAIPISSETPLAGMGASATRYMDLTGRFYTNESDCRRPLKDRTINRLSLLMTTAQTASNVTFQVGAGACTGALTYDGSSVTINATANTPTEGSNAAKTTTGLQCFCIKITSGGSAVTDGYVGGSYVES